MTVFLPIKIYFYLKRFFLLIITKKVFRDKSFIAFNKRNLNRWMNLTKRERYNLSKEQSSLYLNKRKVLLEEIRKEYKRISKENSEKT